MFYITDKNGTIVKFKIVNGDEDLMIMTDSGIIIRLALNQVSKTGRVAQGVKLINLKDNQKVSTIAILDKEEQDENQELVTENDEIDHDTTISNVEKSD